MKPLKKIILAILVCLAVFLGFIIVSNFRFIFPFVMNDEYCVETITDKNDGFTIFLYHNNNCSRHDNHWFEEKGNKYDIMILNKSSFCTECFDEDEVKKIIPISNANIYIFCRNLKVAGADDDYIIKRLERYNTNPQLHEIYF